MNYHQNEYLDLKTLIAEMSSIAAGMVEGSVQALVGRNDELAREVIARDKRVDELDVEIDTVCMKVFALYEPKAIDLRYILTAHRIIVDLERIGDHATNICREVLKLNQFPQIKPYIDIPRMMVHGTAMVKDAVNAYFTRDIKAATDVIDRDIFMNDLHQQIMRELITYVNDDEMKMEGAVNLMFIARSLERIADHAKNVAELVHFMVTGENIRHKRRLEKQEK